MIIFSLQYVLYNTAMIEERDVRTACYCYLFIFKCGLNMQHLLCGGLGVNCQIHECMFLFMNFFPLPSFNDIQLLSENDR